MVQVLTLKQAAKTGASRGDDGRGPDMPKRVKAPVAIVRDRAGSPSSVPVGGAAGEALVPRSLSMARCRCS